ncbi:phosphohexomutase domain-containing protein [Thiohalomonas denitrificans]|uniref:phosphomannomutase n=1 Tax=Thiohalomonas denitrificans TaxID=415747 RepID=A0A1G5QZM5_9GAMM|nr:hypothetical protein [Thiohalomonas denitrificans]SCZ67263.1 Phosphoglucomutase/phosphomannomutase, alpha/beta/alpha domain I [Thiohalomonas denitrificans]
MDSYLLRPAVVSLKEKGLFVRRANDAGVDTLDIGLCGTEMVYFAAARCGMGGGIMVTASHNPMDYNGMKLVREEARPVSSNTGLRDIEALVASGPLSEPSPQKRGTDTQVGVMEDYAAKVLSCRVGRSQTSAPGRQCR